MKFYTAYDRPDKSLFREVYTSDDYADCLVEQYHVNHRDQIDRILQAGEVSHQLHKLDWVRQHFDYLPDEEIDDRFDPSRSYGYDIIDASNYLEEMYVKIRKNMDSESSKKSRESHESHTVEDGEVTEKASDSTQSAKKSKSRSMGSKRSAPADTENGDG